MKSQHGLLLDHVYTGKMMQAVFEEIKTGRFARGSRVLAIHTGGLQGAL
jgi:1-aminocyclopropane-1-carboxylate deaminase